jgi:hypothetical protein
MFKPAKFQTPPSGKRTDHPLGKSPTLLESHCFSERDKQPALKFDMDLNVLSIYWLIPRKPGFLE